MTDLDEFFKKKDRKKTHKKQDDGQLKASDLFAVLENAAQNGILESQEEDRNAKKELQLGPVLAEVINPEEASKWSEEKDEDEERNYDLSNLKLESLPTADEEESTETTAQSDEPVRAAKVWQIPTQKTLPHQREVKTGTPGDRKEEAVAVEDHPRKNKLPAVEIVDKKPEISSKDPMEHTETKPEHHGILETVVSGVESVIGAIVDTVSHVIHPTTQENVEDTKKTKDSEKKDDPAQPTEAPVSDSKPKYIPPAVRAKMEEEAKAAALKASSAPVRSTVASSSLGTTGGIFKPRALLEEEAKAAAMKTSSAAGPSILSSSGTSSGTYKAPHVKQAEEKAAWEAKHGTASGPARMASNKKPELDNEQEFPSLGGK